MLTTILMICALSAVALGFAYLSVTAERAGRSIGARVLIVATAICLVMTCSLIARAQDAGPGDHGFRHRQNHDWYKDLRQPGTGYSCCNGTVDGTEGDCRPTRAYLGDDGAWHALVDGHWVNVPPRVVLKTLAPDGNSHICASKSGTIYFFIGGSPKS
ncbi:MAG TPA: hypothetical protein VMI56_17085 [Reyranella sp.]|nr:hypothetical protein [Reyranella sp.]